MTDLPLSVPTLLHHDNPLAERNPRKVTTLVRELPLMNPVASVNTLLNALEPLNQQAMPGRDRLRLLELYREPVSTLFKAFDTHSLRRVAASTAQRKRLINDIGRLCGVLAAGYKLLVVEGHAAGRGLTADRDQLLAVARAMEQLGHMLLHGFRIYAAAPAGLYQELHALYRYAEAQQALSLPVPGGRSIGDLYRCLMLTACADPLHLPDGVVLALFQTLSEHGGLCRIQPGRGMEPPDGCFVIDLGTDGPPVPCAKVSAKAVLSDPRVMDARDIEKALRAQLRARAGSTDEGELESARRVLMPLLRQLGEAPQRRAVREVINETVAVAIGIPAIHYFLTPGGAQQAQARDETRHTGIEVIEGIDAQPGRDYYRLEDCALLDRSAQGFRLRCTGGNSELRVGELLGIRHTEAPPPTRISLGVVRWLRHIGAGECEIGVELLPGIAAPVTCQPFGETAQHIDQRVGLFLPSQSEPKLAATLLTPKKIYTRGRRLRIDVSQKPLVVEAGLLVLDTACFDRFTFMSTRES